MLFGLADGIGMASSCGAPSQGPYTQPQTIKGDSQLRCRLHPKTGDAVATETQCGIHITRPKDIRISAAGVAWLVIFALGGVIVGGPVSLLPRNAAPAPLARTGENSWPIAEQSSEGVQPPTCG